MQNYQTINVSNSAAYLEASTAAVHRRNGHRGLRPTHLWRSAFVATQIFGAILAINVSWSEDSGTVIPLFYMALLPFYVMRRPRSGLHMSAVALGLVWAALSTMYAFGVFTAPSQNAAATWHFVMAMTIVPTVFILAPLFKVADLVIQCDPTIKYAAAIFVFYIAFYLQWFRFVPWLFADENRNAPLNYFKQ